MIYILWTLPATLKSFVGEDSGKKGREENVKDPSTCEQNLEKGYKFNLKHLIYLYKTKSSFTSKMLDRMCLTVGKAAEVGMTGFVGSLSH